MATLLVMIFFAVTGITLNRPDWFVGQPKSELVELEIPQHLLQSESDKFRPNQAALIEYLKQHSDVRGIASPLEVFIESDNGELIEGEISLNFKGPGYDASVYIDMLNRQGEVESIDFGTVAWLNDLHKGRNTGPIWAWFIDLSAVLMLLFIATGVILLLPKKKTLNRGLRWMSFGTAATVAIYLIGQ